MQIISSIKTLLLGISTYKDAAVLIVKRRLFIYFLFPIIFYLLYFIASICLLSSIVEGLRNYVLNFFYDFNLANWGWLINLITISLIYVVKLIIFLLFAYLSGYIVLVLMSPVISHLSEKTEQIVTGNTTSTKYLQMLKNSLIGVRVAVVNFFSEVGIIAITFIFAFMPVVGLITPFFLVIITAYFYGFSFIDYYLERKNLNTRQRIKFIRKNKWFVIGNGLVFSLFLLIPYVGVLLGAFVCIFSTVAATIGVNKIWEEKNYSKFHKLKIKN